MVNVVDVMVVFATEVLNGTDVPSLEVASKLKRQVCVSHDVAKFARLGPGLGLVPVFGKSFVISKHSCFKAFSLRHKAFLWQLASKAYGSFRS